MFVVDNDFYLQRESMNLLDLSPRCYLHSAHYMFHTLDHPSTHVTYSKCDVEDIEEYANLLILCRRIYKIERGWVHCEALRISHPGEFLLQKIRLTLNSLFIKNTICCLNRVRL